MGVEEKMKERRSNESQRRKFIAENIIEENW